MSIREWTMGLKASLWAAIGVTVPIGLIVIAAFYLAWRFVEPAPPHRVVIAAGVPGGAYDGFAKAYSQVFAENGFELAVRPTAGAMENWKLMLDEDSGVDLAIVQGGTAPSPDQTDDIQALCSIYLEPLWVFYRGEGDVTKLSEFAGKRLAIGKEGSGGRALAVRLLSENGIDTEHPGAAQISDAGGQEAADALKAGKIDAVFLVIAPESGVVNDLMHAPGVKLMSFVQADAYGRRFDYLSQVQLYQGVMDLSGDLPRQDVELIAPAAMLIARKSAHHGTLELLIQTAKTVHARGTILSSAGQFPSALLTDLPVSADALYYLKNSPNRWLGKLPFWAKSLVDRLILLLIPLIAVLLPMMRLAPAMYRWTVRSRIVRWYARLKRVEDNMAAAAPRLVLEKDVHDVDEWMERLAKMHVPAGYMPELYDLREHLERVRDKLRARMAEKAA